MNTECDVISLSTRLEAMSRQSLDNFYDEPIENDVDKTDMKKKSDQEENLEDSKENALNNQHTSDLSLLKDYVVINMENGQKRADNSSGSSNFNLDPPGSDDQSNSPSEDEDNDDNDDDDSDQETVGDSDDEAIAAVTLVCIHQPGENYAESDADSDGSSSEVRGNTPASDDAGESTDSDDPIEDDDDDEDEYDEEESEQEDEDYDSDSNFDPVDNPPLEGQISVAAQTSLTRLSTLNSSLYKTDGEDLSDIALTRSFAALHRQEMVEAGAKTIGELFVGLKRRRAQEITDAENGNGGTSSPQIIQKRTTENEKLKKKPQKLPKSTIPFMEKTADKTRQKHIADDSSSIAVQKKPVPGRSRASPLSCITSGIDMAPEVRGDMGSIQARASTTPSDESLTPESLTRLCHTNNGGRATGGDKSRHSQPMSDLDSRTGYISGRKNPQTKKRAIHREAAKSRIPLPVNNKYAPIPPIGQGQQAVQHQITDHSTNSVNNPARYSKETTPRRYTAHVTQLTCPEKIITKVQRSSMNSQKGRDCSFHKVQFRRLADHCDTDAQGTCTLEKKPQIPHQMKSVACYHNGKLDVSILGDRDILTKHGQDPLNVQITLMPQVKAYNKKENPQVLPPLKNTPRSGQFGNRQKTREINNVKRMENKSAKAKLSCKRDKRKITNRTRSLKQLPPLRRVTMNCGVTAKSTSNRWIPGRSLMDHKMRRDTIVQCRKPVDWDVVNHRAQYPPFNTYTDAEASARFQKIWFSL